MECTQQPPSPILPAACHSPECWQFRFAALEKVLSQLQGHLEALAECRDPDQLTRLVLRRYAVYFELGWKPLRDLPAWNCIDAKLPHQAITQAFATGMIENDQLWIDMLENRPEFRAVGKLEGDDGSPKATAPWHSLTPANRSTWT